MNFDARKAKLLAPGEHIIIDECPGLRLESTSAGRAWIYRYRSQADNKLRQIKIGQWPVISFSAAVDAWSGLRDARQLGKDPALEKKAQRLAAKTAQEIKRNDVKAERYTVAKLCEDYCLGHIDRNRKQKGATEVRRMFRMMMVDLAGQPAATLTRAAAFDLLESFLDIPVQCMSLKRELASAWDYALDAGRLPPETPNWWRQVMNRKIKSKGKVIQGKNIGTAKRVLTSEELATLIKWLPNFPRTAEDALTLYLWTCTRGAEIMAMEAEEIVEEVDGLWWVIPKGKTKNERHEAATDMRVPLIGRAEAIVRRRLAAHSKGYLFPSWAKSGHVEQKQISLSVWERQPYVGVRPDRNLIRLTVTHWAPHDLRRSARTLLASLGCPNEIGEAILGHVQEGIIGVYNLHSYDKERRQWLTLLDAHLESLVK